MVPCSYVSHASITHYNATLCLCKLNYFLTYYKCLNCFISISLSMVSVFYSTLQKNLYLCLFPMNTLTEAPFHLTSCTLCTSVHLYTNISKISPHQPFSMLALIVVAPKFCTSQYNGDFPAVSEMINVCFLHLLEIYLYDC